MRDASVLGMTILFVHRNQVRKGALLSHLRIQNGTSNGHELLFGVLRVVLQGWRPITVAVKAVTTSLAIKRAGRQQRIASNEDGSRRQLTGEIPTLQWLLEQRNAEEGTVQDTSRQVDEPLLIGKFLFVDTVVILSSSLAKPRQKGAGRRYRQLVLKRLQDAFLHVQDLEEIGSEKDR